AELHRRSPAEWRGLFAARPGGGPGEGEGGGPGGPRGGAGRGLGAAAGSGVCRHPPTGGPSPAPRPSRRGGGGRPEASPPGGARWDPEDVAKTGWTVFWMILVPALWCVLWALFTRGGFTFRLMGISLRRADGRRAGRLRCAWRALLFWAPVATLLGLSAWVQ